MQDNTKAYQVSLSDETAHVWGPSPRDMAPLLDIFAPLLEDMVRQNAGHFTAPEWRAMARVIKQVQDFPQGDEGRDLLTLLIGHTAKHNRKKLSGDAALDVEALGKKIADVDAIRMNLILETVQFGHRHFPFHMDTEVWWTLQARKGLDLQTVNPTPGEREKKERKRGPGRRPNAEKIARTAGQNGREKEPVVAGV